MKILLLFDVARPVTADVVYTAEDFLREDKTAESNILASLRRLGHDVETMAVFDNVAAVVDKIKSYAPDVVFNQCESFYDNRALEPNIPALLDLMKIRYTGSGPDGLLLCKDKALAKELLSHHHVRVPRFVVSHSSRPLRRLQHFGYPAFVKPVGQESSDGIAKASFVRDEKEAIERLRYLHQKFNADAMIEEYIEGRELYISVLGNRRRVVFPPREIFFEHVPDDEPKFATSHAKWNDAYRREVGDRQRPRRRASRSGAEGPAQARPQRLHMAENPRFWPHRYSSVPRNEMFVIEANPNPSLAAEDDFAQSANAEGMAYDALIQEILNAALS